MSKEEEGIPRGILQRGSGEIIEHKDATSIMLVSSTIEGSEVGSPGHVYVDMDIRTLPIAINMIAELLIIVEERGGKNAVAQAIGQYAKATGKVQQREGDVDFALIQARKLWVMPE